MLIREYSPGDLEALRRMHARQGFDYAFPYLDDPLFVSKLVVEEDTGAVTMASLARLTCEIYLLMDRGSRSTCDSGMRSVNNSAEGKGTGGLSVSRAASERFTRLLALHCAAEKDLLARGLEDAHAWLPPPIAKKFGRRLESLGWVRDDAWTPYCKRLQP